MIAVLLTACPKDDYVQLYRTHDKAPNLTASQIENLEVMGPTLIDHEGVRGVNFAVYSENATRMEVLFFDDPESNRPIRQFPLTRFGNVWNVFVEGVGLGQHYGYIAWGPNWEYDPKWIPGQIDGFRADVDAFGNRFNPNKLLIDPYAKALHRDHDWSKGSLATGPARTEVTYAAAAKSVVVRSDYQWGPQEQAYREKRKDPNAPGHRWQDLIIYETHLKGVTKSSASGVKHPGTYRGLGEMADYFKDLGVTAVELLPIHEKPLDGGYWGYQNISFFAPEISYAFRQQPHEVIDEFKWMVEELHKRDIEIIIDVVYNHTGEGGLWREKIEIEPSPDSKLDSQLANFDPKEITGLYSFRGLDNQAYYALSDVDRGHYWNNTGVGNQTRPNHRPFRKLILDSLRYYVEELHVDGFRFDLAPVLGENDGPQYYWNGPAPGEGYFERVEEIHRTVLGDIIEDPVLRAHNTRVIAEPWSLQKYAIGGFPNAKDGKAGWYEWNGRFRDWTRELLNCDAWHFNSSSRKYCHDWGQDKGVEDGGALLTGTEFLYGWNGRKPYHAVNFITVHDGFTLYDLFSYEEKINKCGPLNPVCCDSPNSPFCDRDSGDSHNRSRNWGDEGGEAMKRQMIRNAFALLFIAHGTPTMLGGDEWMRTQLGNNNAYSTGADNEWNWFDWGVWRANDERIRMHDFVRSMIALRKKHAHAFARTEYGGGGAPFAWKSPQNGEATWDGRTMMIHYYDPSAGPELAILINMEPTEVPFTLPSGRTWRRLVDTQQHFDTPAYFDSPQFPGTKPVQRSWNATLEDGPQVQGSYGVPGRTLVILEAQGS